MKVSTDEFGSSPQSFLRVKGHNTDITSCIKTICWADHKLTEPALSCLLQVLQPQPPLQQQTLTPPILLLQLFLLPPPSSSQSLLLWIFWSFWFWFNFFERNTEVWSLSDTTSVLLGEAADLADYTWDNLSRPTRSCLTSTRLPVFWQVM